MSALRELLADVCEALAELVRALVSDVRAMWAAEVGP